MGVKMRIGVRFSVALAILSLNFLMPSFAEEVVTSSGTGFVINGDGWIATNAHVLESCTRIAVAGSVDATDSQIDAQNDLAVVRAAGLPDGIVPLKLRSRTPRLGEDVAALGYPLNQILSDSVKITTGNINSLVGLGNDTRYLQISTPIQPGNSGGPLVDRKGNVVGINTATLGLGVTAKTGSLPQNVNFAIRSSVLELFLQARNIAYQVADGSDVDLSTADLAEKVSPATVKILCYGAAKMDDIVSQERSEPADTQVSRPEPEPYIPKRVFVDRAGYDAIGFDYATLKSVSLSQCRSACINDRLCTAVTYNRAVRYCFLKDDAALLVRNKDAVASISGRKNSDVYTSTISVHSGFDIAGRDYRRARGQSFLGCFVECMKDDVCRAFSYVRKTNDCWLKSSIGTMRKKVGVDLGIK